MGYSPLSPLFSLSLLPFLSLSHHLTLKTRKTSPSFFLIMGADAICRAGCFGLISLCGDVILKFRAASFPINMVSVAIWKI